MLGGGFAGLHLIRRLERRLGPGEVELKGDGDAHGYVRITRSGCVAVGEVRRRPPGNAIGSVDDAVRRLSQMVELGCGLVALRDATAPAGFRFVQAEVEAVDVERRAVGTSEGELRYDHLVIAVGSVMNDFGIPGVSEHAFNVKWLSDGERLRRHVLDTFEDAATESDPAKRRELLTFIIVGAGPVGVELASSLRDLMDHTLRRIYPTIDFRREVTIHLLDSADRVIQQMDVRLSRIAMKRLASQRVNVVLRTPVSEIAQNCVRTKDGVELRGRTIVWSGGVKANPLLEKVALPKAKDGRMLVDEFFRASGRDDVLALGDAAYFEHAGRPLPLLAQVAVLEAPAAARNIEALVRGEPLAPFVYKRKGDLVALGRRAAGAELAGLGGIVMGGLPAWTVWRANYLMQLLGARNRGTLLVEWVLSYFAGRLVANTP